MTSNNDINGKLAKPWPDQHAKFVASKDQTPASLMNAMKDNVTLLIDTLYSNNNDRKTRNKVDLIMLRIKSDLNTLANHIKNDNSSTFSKLNDICKNALNDFKADVDHSKSLTKALKEIDNVFEENLVNDDAFQNAKPNASHGINEKDESKEIDKSYIEINGISNAQFNAIAELNASIVKTNELIQKISQTVAEQFNNIENVMNSSMFLFMTTMSTSMNISGMSSMQMKYIIDAMKNVKKLSFKDKNYQSKKKKEESIRIYGMNIEHNMIDGLTKYSQITVIQMAITVKKHYENMCMPFAMILADVKGNAKYTIELINDILQEGFDYFIRKLFKRLQEYVQENIIKPLKKRFEKWILSKIPAAIKRIGDLIEALINVIKLTFRVIRGVFRLIRRFIKKIFTKTFSIFTKTLTIMRKGVIQTLKLLWKMILFALKALFMLIRWAGRGLLASWKWLKNSALGRSIKKFFHKMGTPFRHAKDKFISKYRALKLKGSELKHSIRNNVNKVKRTILSKIGKAKNFISRQFSNVGRQFSRLVPGVVKTSIKRAVKYIAKGFMSTRGFFLFLKNHIKRMVGKKVIKKKSKSIISRVISKLAGGIFKLAQKTLSKAPKKLIQIALITWTANDLLDAYLDLRDSMKIIFIESGNAHIVYGVDKSIEDVAALINVDYGVYGREKDTSGMSVVERMRNNSYNHYVQSGWFEKWWFDKVLFYIGKQLLDFIEDPDEYIKQISIMIKDFFYDTFMMPFYKIYRDIMKFSDEMHLNEMIRRGYHSWPTVHDEHQSYSDEYFKQKVKKLLIDNKTGLFKTKTEKKFIGEIETKLYRIMMNVKRIMDIVRKSNLVVDDIKSMLKYEKMLLIDAAQMGMNNPIMKFLKFSDDRIASDYDVQSGRKSGGEVDDIFFIVDYVALNNEAVQALRFLDFWKNKEILKQQLMQRVSSYKKQLVGKEIDLDKIQKEFEKKQKMSKDFYELAQKINEFTENELIKINDELTILDDEPDESIYDEYIYDSYGV